MPAAEVVRADPFPQVDRVTNSPNPARPLLLIVAGLPSAHVGNVSMHASNAILDPTKMGNTISSTDFRRTIPAGSGDLLCRDPMGNLAEDARSGCNFDDELDPWVVMPDGGLEWRA